MRQQRRTQLPLVYLAGPDVFLENASAVATTKKQICARHGMVGIHPFDTEVNLEGMAPQERGYAIYLGNIRLMDRCDVLVANITPFRGPSLDPGTASELGYMSAQKKRVFAYSNDPRLWIDRFPDATAGVDSMGMKIEPFVMADNLMAIGAIRSGHGVLVCPEDGVRPMSDLLAFEKVIRLASQILGVAGTYSEDKYLQLQLAQA